MEAQLEAKENHARMVSMELLRWNHVLLPPLYC